MGTAALVMGILGVLICGPLAVLAIIFGSMGIQRANAGRATNRGSAAAGLALGIIGTALWFFVLVVLLISSS